MVFQIIKTLHFCRIFQNTNKTHGTQLQNSFNVKLVRDLNRNQINTKLWWNINWGNAWGEFFLGKSTGASCRRAGHRWEEICVRWGSFCSFLFVFETRCIEISGIDVYSNVEPEWMRITVGLSNITLTHTHLTLSRAMIGWGDEFEAKHFENQLGNFTKIKAKHLD